MEGLLLRLWVVVRWAGEIFEVVLGKLVGALDSGIGWVEVD